MVKSFIGWTWGGCFRYDFLWLHLWFMSKGQLGFPVGTAFPSGSHEKSHPLSQFLVQNDFLWKPSGEIFSENYQYLTDIVVLVYIYICIKPYCTHSIMIYNVFTMASQRTNVGQCAFLLRGNSGRICQYLDNNWIWATPKGIKQEPLAVTP